MYAITIIMGKSHHSLLIDEESILKHARKIDRYLAIFLMLSTFMLIALAFTSYFCSVINTNDFIALTNT